MILESNFLTFMGAMFLCMIGFGVLVWFMWVTGSIVELKRGKTKVKK